MAGYGGHFLKGLAGGLQTGLNMGQQIQEMQWQKKQRKALEEKQAKMVEVSNLWNAKIKEIYADNKATDEEISQLTTIYLSGGYEFMDHYQGAMNAIKSMNEKAYNQEIEWINLFIETSAGLPSGDIQAAFDIITPYVTSEKGRNTLEAYSNLQKRRTEALQAQPEDIWGQAGKLPMDIRDEYLRSKGIDIPKAETPITEKAPTAIEQRIAGIDKLEKAGIITKERANESRAKIYGGVMPEETAAGVEPKAETVTTLKNWEKMFDIKAEEGPKTEEEYNRALNLLAQSKDEYKPQYATWKEALIVEVKGIGKELKGTTDKGDYKLLLNIYMQKLEEIKAKYPDVDLGQFSEFEEQKNWFEKLKEKVGL